MDNLIFSINVVAPLFLIMLFGYTAKQLKVITEEFAFEANKFVFRLLIPVMLFHQIKSTFDTDDHPNTSIIIVTLIISAIILLILILAVPLFMKGKGRQGSMIQGIFRSNYVVYGIPLAVGMFGNEAAQTIAVLMGFVIPFFNISAIFILTFFSDSNKSINLVKIIKDILTNPLVFGCIMGGIFGYFEVSIPKWYNPEFGTMKSKSLAMVVAGTNPIGT